MDDEKERVIAFMEVRRNVYYSCEMCDNGTMYLEQNLEKHTRDFSHFLCAMRHLRSLNNRVAIRKVLYRWRERMPTLSFEWVLFSRRRRYMLGMTSVTEELLQDQSNLERLLAHSAARGGIP